MKKTVFERSRSVALAISPLILSSLVILSVYFLADGLFGEYISAARLFISSSEEPETYDGPRNIFVGPPETEKNTEEEVTTKENPSKPETVYSDDIVFPQRGDLYAKLYIDRFNVATDVYFDDSSYALSHGVGQYYGTRPPGFGTPILIGGHNNSHFNALQYLVEGDLVRIVTNYGTYVYSVRIAHIKYYDQFIYDNELKKDKEELILYTCYPFTALGLTRARYIVYCDKVSGPVVTDREV